MSVKLSNIYKSYGKQEVLHNISFEIQQGEIVSFLGANGAGKSTCMKIIIGWLSATSGDVSVCGHNIKDEPIAAKRCIGYLPENNPLYTEMYVKGYLHYTAGLYKLTNVASRVDETIDRIHLNNVTGKTIGTLSKGYKQRVGLAQAILHDPSVLILDEPFSGLDPNQLDEVHELISELGKEKAILFSSHSLQEAKELCKRTIIINNGEIVANTAISELTRERSLDEIFKELTK